MNTTFIRSQGKQPVFEVIVVGGGAAGMMAAETAALAGAKTLLLERNERLGRKLLITGKGRCNVTNDCTEEEFFRNVPTNPKFLFSAISRFSPQDCRAYFESRGVRLKTERGGRVFPVSDQAQEIAAAQEEACRRAGVRIETGRVNCLRMERGRIAGVSCEDGREFAAPCVILATGGKSYPRTGSSGDGYALAASAGHTVTELKPSLVPLVSEDEGCAAMQGLSLRNVELRLWDARKKKPLFSELGELLFTHYGMSGPLVLSASSHIRRFEPGRFSVALDLKPGLDEAQLDARLLRDFGKFANRDFANSLEELLPRKMIPVVVQRSGIPPLGKVHSITKEQRRELVRLLKGLRFSVDGFRPIEEAIVTSGGVKVSEVDPGTMQSKRTPGLYFAGELLDVDGYTGGFNLQIAYATGYAAGVSAAGSRAQKEEAE